MNQSTANPGIPSAIVRKLRQVRQRKMWIHIASAVVAALAVLLAAMCVAMLIDWLATLYDSRWRVVLTVTALSAAMATVLGWVFVARRRLLALDRIAGDVDRQIPQLQERWTTMTRLGDDAANPDVVHPAMYRRVANEAVKWEPRVEPDQVVPLSILVRTMIGLTAITGVLAIAVVLNSHQMLVLVQRFWRPASSISATELVNLPGSMVIGRGEPLALTAAVKGTPVDRATLFLRPDSDTEQTIRMVAHGTEPIEFSHRFRAVEKPFEYRFRAGDGQSDWYTVNVADRPEIEKLTLTVTPPAYTRRETKTFDKLPQRLATIEKSQLELAVRPKAPVESVQLQTGADQFVRMEPDADGWYRWSTTLEEGFTFAPILTESHGLTNRRAPKCIVSVFPDRPPMVNVLTPDDQMAVRPDDIVQITFSANDDVGIGSAELLIYDESAAADKTKPIASIPIELGEDEGARALQKTVDLELQKFAVEHGSELSYEIRVREDRGAVQGTAANRQPATSPTPSSPTRQNAAADSKTASTQGNRETPGEATPREGQDESKMAQASPSTGTPAAPSEQQKPGEPGTQEGQPNAAVAKASTPSDQPSKPGEGTMPQESASPTTPSEPRVAQASKPSDKPSSPADAAKSKSTSPRPDTLAANTPPSGNFAKRDTDAAAKPNSAQSGAKSSSQPNAPQSAANSPSQPNQAQSAANSDAQGKADSQSKSPAADANKMAENQSGKPADPATPREASSGRQGLSTNQKADADQMAKSKDDPATPEDESAKVAKDSPPAANSASQPSDSQNASKNAAQQANNSQSKSAGSQTANQSGNQSKPADSQMAKQDKSESKPSDSQMADQEKNESKPADSQTASQKNNQAMPASNQTAGQNKPNPPSENQQKGDSMTRRMLDVAPPASNTSRRNRLKIDELAGSFSGQQRTKLEMAIAPELEALDKALEKGQKTARGVLDQLDAKKKWTGSHDHEVTSAERSTVEAQELIAKLQDRSKDTPYTFIGLQVADIGLAHVDPARGNFWSALQSEGDDRAGSVHDGWQHLVRARELVAELRGQFEKARREFQLAEAMDKVKKMYQVYIENSQALLQTQASDPTRYNRKRAEFKLDDEYLKRLQEVMEMRRDLRAELARILGDDPRLLRRFMDALRNRSNNLRQELADVAADQEDLNREVRAWSLVDEADRPRMGRILMLRQLQDAAEISAAAGELQSRYQAWLPLNRKSEDADLVAASKMIQEVATAAGELSSASQQFVAESQRVTVANPAPAAPTDTTQEGAQPEAAEEPAQKSLDPLLANAQNLYQRLGTLDVALRQLSAREDNPEESLFAANRLVETRRLIADTSAWVRQMRAHNTGNYTAAAEVDQYRLAMKTDELAGKLGTIEQTLAGLMQREDGSLPEPIAQKAREFITTLDKQVSPNQLAAVYALHSNQLPRATDRQKSAGNALNQAEKTYDELMRLAIAEMDKLPVQDPIADLLDDPTLDELLAQLEQELPIQELLGIPQRPSNLRIIGDWMRPGDGGVATGGGAQWVMQQMRQEQQRTRRQLDEAYRRALARALKEKSDLTDIELPKGTMSDWNKLVSQLGDDLRQGRDKLPPEQYRRAIEQYFAEISRAVAENEQQAP
jgi:hypothetical protein